MSAWELSGAQRSWRGWCPCLGPKGPKGARPGPRCSPPGTARQSGRSSPWPASPAGPAEPCGVQGVGSWPRPSCPSPPQTAECRPPLGGPLSPLHGACFAGRPLPTLESISGAPWVRGPAPRSEVTAAAFIKGPQGPPSPGLCEETPQLPLQRGVLASCAAPGSVQRWPRAPARPPARRPRPGTGGPQVHTGPERGPGQHGDKPRRPSPLPALRLAPSPRRGDRRPCHPPAPPGARRAPGLGGKLPAASASRLRFANAPIFHAVTSFLASRDNKILV